jgi:predicted metal-dependent hydrolase
VRRRTRVRSAGAAPRWGHGTTLLLRGEAVTIHVIDRDSARVAVYGNREVSVPDEAGDLRPYLEADLRALAREQLPARLAALAAANGLSVAGVTIRNQRSRWGSCSRDGRIALNFRLVQMPFEVADYVLLHELMHLEQQNHSIRFWRLVERVCPGFRSAERWLKTEGRGLF